ncbi:formin-like protein 5 isoform X1 [Oryza sativa Japonica Group]|uniref:Uncharacterized protein n=1 Tax=Oryza rufipogon TaxID=4529 RepID=A0A0E0NZR8_ORYRU|nr:formin-like protein 20 isoform X1 [Oryza sativa Japonica Group]KAF2940727.1 hypothetical protein DAI22_03g295500 [Oryza sativa Japonica Group]
MSEHLALRSSVGSHSSALPPSYHHHRRLPPPQQQHPDPLNSVWIRRLHLLPHQPPPPPPPPPLPQPQHHHDAVSTDESRTPPPPPPPMGAPGFGPFRWSPRPLRGAPLAAWDAASPVRSGGGGGGGTGPPMLSPFFRLPAPSPSPPVTDFGEFSPTMPLFEVGSSSGSGGFPGPSSRMIPGGSSSPFAMGVAAAAYPSHAVDMVPIRTLQDIHDRQQSVIPRNFAMRSPSSGSQHDGFSYWNMGRFRRNTTTSLVSPTGVTPSSFGKKRNADSSNFLPLKFRKMSGAT